MLYKQFINNIRKIEAWTYRQLTTFIYRKRMNKLYTILNVKIAALQKETIILEYALKNITIPYDKIK